MVDTLETKIRTNKVTPCPTLAKNAEALIKKRMYVLHLNLNEIDDLISHFFKRRFLSLINFKQEDSYSI